MLIYNFQKEFLGIDDSDLKKIGFSNLSELRAEAADFADLFVKTPGFVHNFKHVHWIDFVECAESAENASVIIHANSKSFRCTLDIKTAYLVDSPSKKAYLIYLNNLRELSKEEKDQVANDIYERPAPVGAAEVETPTIQTQKPAQPVQTFSEPVLEAPITQAIDDPFEDNAVEENIDVFDDKPIDLDIDDDFTLDVETENTVEKVDEVEDTHAHEPAIEIDEEDEFDNSYTYDPHVASDELGLPLDLIEEFIEDFIAQAKEFKEPLYNAYNTQDTDQVKVLSHKLKGVAANLRIEDAFEVLATINTSDDQAIIKINLDRFYKIIAKLSDNDIAEEIQPVSLPQSEPEEEDEDEFTISFKEDELEVEEEATETPEIDDVLEIEKLVEVEEPLQIDETLEIDEPIQISEQLELDEPLELEEVPDIPEEIEEPHQEISYDKTSVANEIGIDIESFSELFSDFITEGKLLINDINTSIEEKNIEMWRKNALKLKGMSSNMRVDSLKQDLDTLIGTDDANTAKEATDKLQTSLEKISTI